MTRLRKRFGHHEVLRGVSLSVARGEVVAVIGPQVRTQSTFLRCLNHLETIDGGQISIEETGAGQHRRPGPLPLPGRAQVRRICAKTGMVFQQLNLFPHLTGAGKPHRGAAGSGRSARRGRGAGPEACRC